VSDPLDYTTDQRKQEALGELEKIGACIGPHDATTIHVEMTPAYGQVPIGDAELHRIVDCVNALGNVYGLDLGETAITDASAWHLGRLRNVTFLSLNGTAVTNQTLPFLKSVGGLQELVLSGTHITDSAVETLLELKALTFLQLYGTRITSKGIAILKAKRPGVVEA
jgi:hypothetical protein